MPNRLIAIPTTTRTRRAPVLELRPTLPAATKKPKNVTASPTSPIVSSSLLCRDGYGSACSHGLRVQKDRNRGREPDQENRSHRKVAIYRRHRLPGAARNTSIANPSVEFVPFDRPPIN